MNVQRRRPSLAEHRHSLRNIVVNMMVMFTAACEFFFVSFPFFMSLCVACALPRPGTYGTFRRCFFLLTNNPALFLAFFVSYPRLSFFLWLFRRWDVALHDHLILIPFSRLPRKTVTKPRLARTLAVFTITPPEQPSIRSEDGAPRR